VVVAAAGGAVLLADRIHPPAAPSPVSPSTPPLRLVCSGHIDVDGGVAALTPARPGAVRRVLVRDSQQVKADEPLIELDDRPLQAQLREIEAQLRAADIRLVQARKRPAQHAADVATQKAAIAGADARLAAARQMHTHRQNLLRSNLSTEEEVKAAAEQVHECEAAQAIETSRLRKLELDEPKSAIALAQAEVDGLAAKRDAATQAIADGTLRAPSAGEILRILVSEGEFVIADARQPAIFFAPDRPRIVRAEVPQEFADRVAIGLTASIQDDTRSDRQWRGRIIRISNWFARRRSVMLEALPRTDERTLECVLSLDPSLEPARIGQRVRVMID
jgi:multidrug resistance efflux pump